jgi:hypothetical protein
MAFIAPEADFQIHCVAYPMHSQRGSTDLSRYWITIDKKIIWDYPKQFLNEYHGKGYHYSDNKAHRLKDCYPYGSEVSDISELIREYLNTPKDKLLEPFTNDKWGLTDILRVCDVRVGKRRLLEIKQSIHKKTEQNLCLLKIINKRLM